MPVLWRRGVRTFRAVLELDLPDDDERGVDEIRLLVWEAITALSADELRDVIPSVPSVTELDER